MSTPIDRYDAKVAIKPYSPSMMHEGELCLHVVVWSENGSKAYDWTCNPLEKLHGECFPRLFPVFPLMAGREGRDIEVSFKNKSFRLRCAQKDEPGPHRLFEMVFHQKFSTPPIPWNYLMRDFLHFIDSALKSQPPTIPSHYSKEQMGFFYELAQPILKAWLAGKGNRAFLIKCLNCAKTPLSEEEKRLYVSLAVFNYDEFSMGCQIGFLLFLDGVADVFDQSRQRSDSLLSAWIKDKKLTLVQRKDPTLWFHLFQLAQQKHLKPILYHLCVTLARAHSPFLDHYEQECMNIPLETLSANEFKALVSEATTLRSLPLLDRYNDWLAK